MEFGSLLQPWFDNVRSYPESKVIYNSPTRVQQIKQTKALATNQLREYLFTCRQKGIHLPEAVEKDALTLFDNDKGEAQMRNELAIIFCIYTDFDPDPVESNKYSSADKRIEKASEYLTKHPVQREILQSIFPPKYDEEQGISAKKVASYGNYCWGLEQTFFNSDRNAYNQALKTSMAIMTLCSALEALENSIATNT